MDIRSATLNDLENITQLYNHHIKSDHVTFDTQPFRAAERQDWLASFDNKRLVCLVAMEGQQFLGYATSTVFKPKPAYSRSVEVSVYAKKLRRGIGRALYEALFQRITAAGVHRAYAGIALPNDASIQLHKSFQFHQVAKFHEVGYKFDTYWDVIWMEKDCEPA